MGKASSAFALQSNAASANRDERTDIPNFYCTGSGRAGAKHWEKLVFSELLKIGV